MRLFHISEEPGIPAFEPRPAPSPDAGVQGDVVWAIDEAHLPNYLLPRDCPRVTFAASGRTTPTDKDRFLMGSRRVIAVESGWFPKLETCRLFLYEFPAESFEPLDAGAGYFVSRKAVAPLAVTALGSPIAEILSRKVELRLIPDLWALRDAVAASSLEYSIIRFRNASPRLGKD